MSASEIKYVYSEWESKGQAVLLPYALQYNYEEIDGLLKDMDNIANEAGLGGIGYQSQESDITKLAEWAGYLNAYISSVIPELQESLDKPLYIAFNHHAAEDLSRIRMEDYTTENKLGIKRWVTVPGTEGMPTRELVEDTTLSMEDFLGLTVLEEAGERKIIGMPKEFRDFTDMFAVDYNLIKDELEKQNGKEVTLEEYLLSIKSAGEFSHKMDKPVEEFISAVLDITAVKPLIECCTGYDMITGEDLSDFERGMKGVSAVVSLFTLGQGSIVMNGGKLALGETLKMGAKMLAVDAISTGVAYGTSEICQAMGCPGGLTLVLSLLAGMGTSVGLGSKVFGNGGLTPDDIAYQRYWDKGVSETRVFSSNDEAYNYYMELAENLDVSTEKNTAIFYSGPGNRELAEAFAKINGKTTLEMTNGGKYLDELQLFADKSILTKEQAADVWKKLSERYAKGSSGNVYGFVEGSWEGSIFNTVEYPALKSNPNIENIFTELFKNGGN